MKYHRTNQRTRINMPIAPTTPPLDGSISVLPGLVDFHAEHNPQHPWAMLAHASGGGASPVSFSEYAQATHRIAHVFRPGRAGDGGEVVAILAHCDTLLYLALIPGLVRAGLVVRPSYTLDRMSLTHQTSRCRCPLGFLLLR